jgi:hypothetical protein
MDNMDWCWTESRHPTEHAHARQDKIIDRWFVFQWPAFTETRDRATDQAWVEAFEPRGFDQGLSGRAGCEIIDQDIRASDQTAI